MLGILRPNDYMYGVLKGKKKAKRPIREEDWDWTMWTIYSSVVSVHQVENTVRWRPVKDEEGNELKDELEKPLRESNARVVKWSDGRWELVIALTSWQSVDHSFAFESHGLRFLAREWSKEVWRAPIRCGGLVSEVHDYAHCHWVSESP